MTREEAARRMLEIRAEPEYFDRALNPLKHDLLTRELNSLAAVGYADEPEPEDVRVRRSAAEKARAELEALRREPAFFNPSADPLKNEQLQQKVAELTAIVVAGEAASES